MTPGTLLLCFAAVVLIVGYSRGVSPLQSLREWRMKRYFLKNFVKIIATSKLPISTAQLVARENTRSKYLCLEFNPLK